MLCPIELRRQFGILAIQAKEGSVTAEFVQENWNYVQIMI
jgi:hypothetical protein